MILVLCVPFLIGSRLPLHAAPRGSAIKFAVDWWKGAFIAGFSVILANSLGCSFAGASLTVAALSLFGLVRLAIQCRYGVTGPNEEKNEGGCRTIWCVCGGMICLITVLLQVEVLAHPLSSYDALAFWYPKVQALSHDVDFMKIPRRDYPDLGPALWALTSLTSASDDTRTGRLFIPVGFAMFLLAMCAFALENCPRDLRALPLALCPVAVSLSLLRVEFFTNGYMDGFLMSAFGIACLCVIRGLRGEYCRDSNLILAACFSGGLGLIKNEGAVLGVILMSGLLMALLLRKRFGGVQDLKVPFLIASAFVTSFVFFPCLKVVHGSAALRVQEDSFTVDGVLRISDRIDRLPRIFWYVSWHVRKYRWTILNGFVMVLFGARMSLSWRPTLAMVTTIYILQLAFVIVAFLSTNEPLEWHLSCAFERLAYQGNSILILMSTVGLRAVLRG